MVGIEDKAPDFRLSGSDGKEHTLGEFKDRYLVLYFYPKDNTPGCTMEANEFNNKIDRIRELGGEVVGISKDDLKSHEKFIAGHGLKFLLLADTDSKTIKEYGAYGDRGIFGTGTLRKTFIINRDGKIIKAFDKVDPKGHAKEVIDVLEILSQM